MSGQQTLANTPIFPQAPVAVALATNAGLKTIFTASGTVLLRSFALRSNIDHTAGDLTSVRADTHTGNVNSLFDAVAGIVGSFNADGAQVNWGGDQAGIVLENGESVFITVAGVGVSTTDMTIHATWSPQTSGASLTTVGP